MSKEQELNDEEIARLLIKMDNQETTAKAGIDSSSPANVREESQDLGEPRQQSEEDLSTIPNFACRGGRAVGFPVFVSVAYGILSVLGAAVVGSGTVSFLSLIGVGDEVAGWAVLITSVVVGVFLIAEAWMVYRGMHSELSKSAWALMVLGSLVLLPSLDELRYNPGGLGIDAGLRALSSAALLTAGGLLLRGNRQYKMWRESGGAKNSH